MRGDVAIAPVDWTEILTLQDKGAPVEIIVSEEGVLSYEQSFNVVRWGFPFALVPPEGVCVLSTPDARPHDSAST